jgi:hypothetical protein
MASLAPQTVLNDAIPKLLNLADIRINGERSWGLQLHDERLFWQVTFSQLRGGPSAYRPSGMR